MKLALTATICFALLSVGCASESEKSVETEAQFQVAVLSISNPDNVFYQPDYPLFQNVQEWMPSERELIEINAQLESCVIEYNELRNSTLDVERYNRQLVPIKLENGDRIVFVQCFCHDVYEGWDERVLDVRDGGNCFFRLTMSLDNKDCWNFIVNGTA